MLHKLVCVVQTKQTVEQCLTFGCEVRVPPAAQVKLHQESTHAKDMFQITRFCSTCITGRFFIHHFHSSLKQTVKNSKCYFIWMIVKKCCKEEKYDKNGDPWPLTIACESLNKCKFLIQRVCVCIFLKMIKIIKTFFKQSSQACLKKERHQDDSVH